MVVLMLTVMAVVSNAADEPSYWTISSKCLVKSKEILDDDGVAVSTFKETDASSNVDGLLVGIPVNATVGDELFQANDGYSCVYVDKNDEELVSDDTHIGTTDKLVVYSGRDIVAEYGLVTYGDADGDGVFDVIDSAIASLCVNGKMTSTDSPSVYEAMKPVSTSNSDVDEHDYQYIVNNSFNAVESNKGRKKPIDQTISYESVIYNSDGTAKNAPIVANEDLKSILKVTYNGDTTVPAEPGVYAVSAIIEENEKYLVTPQTVNLGFMVLTPKDSSGNYNIAVDNSSDTITVNIENAYTPNATLNADFEKWLNKKCTLIVDSTSNPETVASKLPKREFAKYIDQSKLLQTEPIDDILGSYLPDDDTLWKNSDAQNSTAFSVSANGLSYSYKVIFKQDAETVKNNIYTMRKKIAEDGRGQRTDNPTSKCASNYLKFKNNYPTISIAVNNGNTKFISGLQSTGLKSMLLGYVDSVAIKAGKSVSAASSASKVSLFETEEEYNYKRFSTYTSADLDPKTNLAGALRFAKLANAVTGINYLTLATGTMSSTINTTGYCDYLCVGSTNGLRYHDMYYMEYINYNASQHSHYTVTTSATNGTVAIDSNYPNRFAVDEFFYVTATPNTGYKLDKVTVTNASTGAVITPDENGRYIMPASNVTVAATFVAK